MCSWVHRECAAAHEHWLFAASVRDELTLCLKRDAWRKEGNSFVSNLSNTFSQDKHRVGLLLIHNFKELAHFGNVYLSLKPFLIPALSLSHVLKISWYCLICGEQNITNSCITNCTWSPVLAPPSRLWMQTKTLFSPWEHTLTQFSRWYYTSGQVLRESPFLHITPRTRAPFLSI